MTKGPDAILNELATKLQTKKKVKTDRKQLKVKRNSPTIKAFEDEHIIYL